MNSSTAPYIRCPHCNTVFAMPAELPAHGKVRCGVCTGVFEAQLHQLQQLPEEPVEQEANAGADTVDQIDGVVIDETAESIDLDEFFIDESLTDDFGDIPEETLELDAASDEPAGVDESATAELAEDNADELEDVGHDHVEDKEVRGSSPEEIVDLAAISGADSVDGVTEELVLAELADNDLGAEAEESIDLAALLEDEPENSFGEDRDDDSGEASFAIGADDDSEWDSPAVTEQTDSIVSEDPGESVTAVDIESTAADLPDDAEEENGELFGAGHDDDDDDELYTDEDTDEQLAIAPLVASDEDLPADLGDIDKDDSPAGAEGEEHLFSDDVGPYADENSDEQLAVAPLVDNNELTELSSSDEQLTAEDADSEDVAADLLFAQAGEQDDWEEGESLHQAISEPESDTADVIIETDEEAAPLTEQLNFDQPSQVDDQSEAAAEAGTVAQDEQPLANKPTDDELTDEDLRPVRSSRWWLVMHLGVGVLLLAVIGGQLLYLFREPLKDHPVVRPWQQSLCSLIGCELPHRRDTTQLGAVAKVVISHPRFMDALHIALSLQNRAEYAQPFPTIRLLFLDGADHPVAGRDFVPEEYLLGPLAGKTLLQPMVPEQIVLEIKDPGPEAVNYRFSYH